MKRRAFITSVSLAACGCLEGDSSPDKNSTTNFSALWNEKVKVSSMSRIGGGVAVGTDRSVVVYNKDGSQRWNTKIDEDSPEDVEGYSGAIAVDNNGIYTSFDSLLCLSLDDGSIVWENKNLNGHKPIVKSNGKLLTETNGSVTSVIPDNGEKQWEISCKGPGCTAIATAENRAYLGTADGTIYAASDDGTVVGHENTKYIKIQHISVAPTGILVAAKTNDSENLWEIAKFDQELNIEWSLTTQNNVFDPPLLHDDILYIPEFEQIERIGIQGERQGTIDVAESRETTTPKYRNGELYFGGGETLHIVSISDTSRQRLNSPTSIRQAPVIFGDRAIVAGIAEIAALDLSSTN